ncbi:MAG: CAP domain-containing protein [Hyphomonas sp.]
MSLLALAIAAPGVALSEAGSMARLSPDESTASASVSVIEGFNRDLLRAVQFERRGAGVPALQEHETLSLVAEMHARDMARRNYAADVSPEGFTLLEAVRQADRKTLYSAFGTTIAIVDAGMNAEAVLEALMSDSANAENVLRTGFDHVGVGAVEQDGRLYVVQLLARVEGQLSRPLPLNASAAESLRANFAVRGMTPVSWSVSDSAGETLMRGSGDRIRDPRGTPVEGYLNLDVAMGADVYTLRGPYVRVN